MKRLVIAIIFLYFLSACKSMEDIYMQKNIMEITSQITYIDEKRGFLTLKWYCANPPFKHQPCEKFQEFPIYMFDNPVLGEKYTFQKIKTKEKN